MVVWGGGGVGEGDELPLSHSITTKRQILQNIEQIKLTMNLICKLKILAFSTPLK